MGSKIENARENVERSRQARDQKGVADACKAGLDAVAAAGEYETRHYDASFFLYHLGEMVQDVASTIKFYEQSIGAAEADMQKRPTNNDAKSQYCKVVFQKAMLLVRVTDHPPALEAAIRQLAKSRDMARDVYGDKHINVLLPTYSTGLIYERMQKNDKALEVAEEAAVIAREPKNFMSDIGQLVISQYVHLLQSNGKLEQAEEVANSAFEYVLREKALTTTPFGPACAHRSAGVKLARNQIEEAEKLVKLGRKFAEKLLPGSPLVAQSNILYAQVLDKKAASSSSDADKTAEIRREQQALLAKAKGIYIKTSGGADSPDVQKCDAFLEKVKKGQSMMTTVSGGTSSGGISSPYKNGTKFSTADVKAKLKSASTQNDGEQLLSIAEALFRHDNNYLLAEHVLDKAREIFESFTKTDPSELVKKRLEVSNYNLKIMRRNRIIELWDQVVDDSLSAMETLSLSKASGEAVSSAASADSLEEDSDLAW